jgi:hypothetical protein
MQQPIVTRYDLLNIIKDIINNDTIIVDIIDFNKIDDYKLSLAVIELGYKQDITIPVTKLVQNFFRYDVCVDIAKLHDVCTITIANKHHDSTDVTTKHIRPKVMQRAVKRQKEKAKQN